MVSDGWWHSTTQAGNAMAGKLLVSSYQKKPPGSQTFPLASGITGLSITTQQFLGFFRSREPVTLICVLHYLLSMVSGSLRGKFFPNLVF